MFFELERLFSFGESSSLLLPDPHRQAIISAGKLLEKITKQNYYEWEIDLYFLTKAIFQYFYMKFSKTQKDLSIYYHYIQHAQTKFMNNKLEIDEDKCLESLKSVVHLDQFAFIYLVDIIKHFCPDDKFHKLIPYIESFIVFRSHFDPDTYKRIWYGIPDTEFIHKAYKQNLQSSHEIVEFYWNHYPHDTCPIKQVISMEV